MDKKIKKIKEYTRDQMIKYCIKTELSILHELKFYLDDLYYNTDKSSLSDDKYDILKDIISERDPEYMHPIGAKIRNNENRVKIPYYMGSTNKITPDDTKELDRWLDNNPCEDIFISEKLDGVSGTFVFKDGERKLYTRGDGIEGGDISYLIKYINSIPKNLNENISVRGELIIKKSIFDISYKSSSKEKVDNKYKNGRNMVSGIVGSKKLRKGVKDLEFIVYEIIDDITMPRPCEQFKKLEKIGFKTAKCEKIKCKGINMDTLVNVHNNFKKQSEYEIDGIVIQSNIEYDRNISGNPSYLFALKVLNEEMIVETKVLDIEWSVSCWGQIIPVAILEPVELPGVTISRVTLSNAGLMEKKCIGPGSIVNVTRSNEVIPFIVSVIEPCEKIKWPEMSYKWDKTRVHINVVDADEKITKEMKVKLFVKFFVRMGIKHVSKQTVSKLYDNGFDSLLKICGIKKEDLLKIEGIKEKSATRIIDNLRNGLNGMNIGELLGSSGVFGIGIGSKKVNALMNDIPDLLTGKRKGMKKRILAVEGFSELTAEKVYDNIDKAIEFIDGISNFASFTKDTRVSNDLVGKKFVFSGFRSKELEQYIIDRGGKYVNSVSSKTSGVIVTSKEDSKSMKISKALNLGIPIYTKEEFKTKFI